MLLCAVAVLGGRVTPLYFLLVQFQVNVSDLGLVTTTGKVVWGKYAQVTNDPENDGCVNAVLLV